jgi:hypothetical protein
MLGSKFLTLLCLLCALTGSAHAVTKWTQCGIKGAFEIKNATLTPLDIYPGNSARFTIDGIGADHDVADGQITMLVRIAGLPIYTQSDDFCKKTACPVAANSETTIVYEENFPEITPPGSYSVTLSGKSGAGEQLFCVIISFEVKAPTSLALQSDVEAAADSSSSPSSSDAAAEQKVSPLNRLSAEVARFLKSRKFLYPYQEE